MREFYRQLKRNEVKFGRISFISYVFGACFLLLMLRLFFIQIVAHDAYQTLADKQHLNNTEYIAERGEILARDHTNVSENDTYPLAINKKFNEVYLNPTEITRPINTAQSLSEILGVSFETVLERAKKENRVYEPVTMKATDEQVEEIKKTQLSGIYFQPNVWRYYPDKSIGSHILGFYGIDGDSKKGKYGIEGYWDKELAGINQNVIVARDRTGSIIPESDDYLGVAVDGSDLVLTIDRTIQYEACRMLENTIEKYAADKGTVIVMESKTGKIRAMCNFPAFDPNAYNEVPDVQRFNNDAVFEAYEPGSVFKPVAMAIAVDTKKVIPTTTYEDKGETKIADRIIRNFDKKAHGVRTMTEVLQLSLNLGIVFATRSVPNSIFYDYIKKFGFGEKTGIDLSQESAGSLGNLGKQQDIYKATASYGQGISVTPLQMLAAINVFANDGILVKPFIIDEIRTSNDVVIRPPLKNIRQVVSKETARTITAMLVQVVEEGYDSKASVQGYYLAGKTGTAQVAQAGGYGNVTNHTFAGFGPIPNTKFSILIKLYNVRNVNFASDSTARFFHDIAEFLLRYYKIPPSK